MHRRTFPVAKACALVGCCLLVCLSLSFSALAASEEKVVADTVTAPSALITWDMSAQKMTTVEAAKAAQLLEQFRGQMEARLIATGRLAPSGEVQVVTTPSGLKRAKATVDMMSFSVVRVDEEGQLIQACFDDSDAAEDVLVTPAAAKEEK